MVLTSASSILLLAILAWGAAPVAAQSPKPARVLLVTGVDYPGHLWRETAPVLASALRKDPRLQIVTVEDPQVLDSAALHQYAAVILHFQSWEQPGPDQRARENLEKFIQSGGGVVLVHFACGAWVGEWPDFEKIAGRVWFGPKPPAGRRQHDPLGPFQVEVAAPAHPIMRGLADFQTRDELYTCLTGEYPIQVLAHAKSKLDGKYYPIAFVSEYGKGRTFHSVLGHDVQALKASEVQELYRRGVAWAASLPPVAGSAQVPAKP